MFSLEEKSLKLSLLNYDIYIFIIYMYMHMHVGSEATVIIVNY